jgi:uncharacterized protein YhfF
MDELPDVDVEAVERFFADAIASGAVAPNARYGDADCFGDTPALADRLLDLILHGPKRATAGSVVEYEAAGVALPAVGGLFVATDGGGRPRAVLRTTEVRVGPLSSVDDQFAWDEGEGDRTRKDWLRMHTGYFTRAFKRLGIELHSDPEVVFERFEVVYPTTRAGCGPSQS